MSSISTTLVRSALLLSVLLLFVTLPASAQLELDQDGRVGVGGGPFSLFRLSAFNSESGAIFASYSGSSNAAAIIGQAHSYPGSGVGGEFHGGKMGLSAYAISPNPSSDPNDYVTGIYTKATGSNVNNGVHAYAFKGRVARALRAHAHGDNATEHAYGLYAFTNGSATNGYGGYGDVVSVAGKTGYGVYGRSLGGGTNYGVYGEVSSSSGQTGYGVYGHAHGSGTKWAGYFQGNVKVTGTFDNPSDAKFKEGVESLASTGMLDRVLALEPRRYQYRQDALGQRMGFSEGLRFGFVAQELEEVFPELVSQSRHTLPAIAASAGGVERSPKPRVVEAAMEVSYKSVNYLDLIPVLVQAIQEQQAEIETQQAFLASQQAEIQALKDALSKLGVTVE